MADVSHEKRLLLKYDAGSSDKLTVGATGTGDITDFVSNLENSEAAFGFVRCIVGNDELSRRVKFVLVCWCGPDVKVYISIVSLTNHHTQF